jgi:uncharacterized protein (TIGR03437 family)
MKLALLGAALAALAAAQTSSGPTVRMKTNMGEMDILLLQNVAPRTVANFLSYVNKGAYNGSFFHRLVPGFVLQGGGYKLADGLPKIPADPPVRNEFNISNTRGTIAMAKLDGNPDSATTEWFFNLGDNSANLNGQNGGFTVFARVANDAGMALLDAMAAVPTYNLGSPFDQVPLRSSGGSVQQGGPITIESITVLDPPAIDGGGVTTAADFGGFAFAAPGSFIEVKGTNIGPETPRTRIDSDFVNGVAPTSLGGVSVSLGGVPAFVSYASLSQITAQIPANTPLGEQVSVVVSRGGATSPTTRFQIRQVAPGLRAPARFKVGDIQFAAALHADGTFVSDGTIPDTVAAPAVPGETITFHGTGFGYVDGPVSIAGRVAPADAPLLVPVEFKFAGIAAEMKFGGISKGQVGLYRFDVVVPAGLPDGNMPIEVTVAGEIMPQSLAIPVKN